jgi:NADH-quinone oxidoreductase subunit H
LNLLFLFCFSSITIYGVILAGWASNSRYAFLGSLRSAAQMISYEISLGLIIINVGLVCQSLNLLDIILIQIQDRSNFYILFPLGIIFLISILAETNRAPFDLPEAEAELVAGYNVEYSSILFAFFFLAEYSNMFLMCTLFVILFFSNLSFFSFILKILFFMFFFI